MDYWEWRWDLFHLWLTSERGSEERLFFAQWFNALCF